MALCPTRTAFLDYKTDKDWGRFHISKEAEKIYTCKFTKINPLRNGSWETKSREETYPLFSQMEGNKYSVQRGARIYSEPWEFGSWLRTICQWNKGPEKYGTFPCLTCTFYHDLFQSDKAGWG